jgi:hypothetical protein
MPQRLELLQQGRLQQLQQANALMREAEELLAGLVGRALRAAGLPAVAAAAQHGMPFGHGNGYCPVEEVAVLVEEAGGVQRLLCFAAAC